MLLGAGSAPYDCLRCCRTGQKRGSLVSRQRAPGYRWGRLLGGPVAGHRTTESSAEQRQRRQCKDHGRGGEFGPSHGKHRTREQPEYIDGQSREGDFRVTSPATRERLIEVTAMRFVDSF